ANIAINGAADAAPKPVPQGDKFVISPYTDSGTCATPGTCIQVQNFDALTGAIPLAELAFFKIAGTTSLTINGGPGGDKVEFTGDFLAPGTTLTVHAESIKVDSGVTIDTGTGNIVFDAKATDDGTSLLGITTTLLGDGATIELDGATLTGNTIDL